MPNLVQWYAPETGTGWDSTKVYSSTDQQIWTLVATVSPITVTSYWDSVGDSTYYYKIAFYDTSALIQGPYSNVFAAAANATMYTNPTELRKFMQFAVSDFPDDEDVTLLLEQATVQLNQDVVGNGQVGNGTIGETNKLKLLSLLLGSTFLCRSLAMKALSKGYVAVSLEGGNIMKAHDALMRMADYWYEKYQDQLAKDTVDFTMTKFWDSAIDSDVSQDLKDMMNGVSNALDYQNTYLPSMTGRSGNW